MVPGTLEPSLPVSSLRQLNQQAPGRAPLHEIDVRKVPELEPTAPDPQFRRMAMSTQVPTDGYWRINFLGWLAPQQFVEDFTALEVTLIYLISLPGFAPRNVGRPRGSGEIG